MPANPTARSNPPSGWQGGTLLLLAAVVRVAVLWQYGGNLAEDHDHYRGLAERLVAGDGYVDPETLSPTAYRPPLYPLLLAGILFCGGGNLAIGIAHLGLGVATVALTVLCSRRLEMGGGSFAAGLLVAVDPLLLYQTALVMTETLATFLAVLLLWLSLGPSTPWRNFAVGLTFGLCCLCRPTFWAFGVLAFAGGLVSRSRARRTSEACTMTTPRACFAVAAGLLLVIVPWAIRNTLVMGRPIVTTTHGGYTLLLAHNPAYTRAVVEQPWGAVWEGAAYDEWYEALEADLARATPPIDKSHLTPAVELSRDEWMSRRARDYIQSEPLVAVRAGLTLLSRFWGLVPLTASGRPLSGFVRLSIGAFYALVFAALLAGLVRVARWDWRRWWPCLALLVAFTLVHALYWADMRMRTPLVPAIALLAARSLPIKGRPPVSRNGFETASS